MAVIGPEKTAPRRFAPRGSLLPALLFIALMCSAFSATSANLHTDMLRVLQHNDLTGAVWATVSAEGAITVDAAGVKDARTGELLGPEHRVQVGSVAKTLLATGVLRLVTEGRLSLDAPVAHWVAQPNLDNPWDATDPVRLRHLLDHTSGLDDAHLWQVFSLKPHADTPLAEAFAGSSDLLRVRSRPGTRFSYSNMGYTLAGMVIEAVTGQRYETYLAANLLQPLEMRNSTFFFVSQTGPDADPSLAMGHFEHAVPASAVPSYLRPAGQFTTTAQDMAIFSRFLLSDGRIKGQLFIKPDLLRAMGLPSGTEAARAGLPAGYGLGLGRSRYSTAARCHEGSTVGYRAMLCVFPEHRKAFFLGVNCDSETASYAQLYARLVKALNVAEGFPKQRGAPTPDIASWQGIYVPAPGRFESFALLDTVLNLQHVSWDGTHLKLRSLQTADKLLVPEGGVLFRATDRAATSHVLLTAPDGRRVMSSGFQSYEQASWLKIVLLWASLCAGLVGSAFIFLSGLVRLVTRRLTRSHPIFLPFLAVVALLLPVPLFVRQSFLQLGDLTLASAVLALVTALLPLGMLAGLLTQWRRRATGKAAVTDAAAMLAVVQWTGVMAAWGFIPLRLWA